MADPTLSPWPRRVITIGGILRDWACQTLMGFGLVMLVALSIFAFDLDALYRFMARFSAQYVDAKPTTQATVRATGYWGLVAVILIVTARMMIDGLVGWSRQRRKPKLMERQR